MAEPDTSWRAEINRQERVKVCQHIMRKLAMYYSSTPEAVLKQRTRAFENQAYSNATSRDDYLQKIAQGLTNIESRVQHNQAKQMSLHVQGNHPNAQAQAALRQQLRQHQHNPQAIMRQRQLMAAQHQQQQLQLQAQQVLMRQQHVNSVKQQHDPTRKSPAIAKRAQPAASDPKAKPLNVPTGKPSATAAQTAALATHGKAAQVGSHTQAATDPEDLRRKAEINAKQPPFDPSQSQNPANGAGVSNEYLVALARQHQIPLSNVSQAQPQGPVQTTQQLQNVSQPQPHLPPGSVVPGVLSAQQQILQQQQAAHPNGTSIAAHRASQGMLQQGVNRAGAVVQDGMIAASQEKVESRRSRIEAVVAAVAAAAGIKCTPEQIRGLSPDKLQQILHMASQPNSSLNASAMQGSMLLNRQVRMADGQTAANPHPSAGMATNMANWIGHFGNAAAQGANGQVNIGVGQNHLLSRPMSFDERKQQLQQASGSQAAVATAPGKHDSSDASTGAAGVTVPQMNEILARQKVKMEKPGSTPQDKKAAIAEALQDAKGRSSRAVRSTPSRHVAGGGNAVAAGAASARTAVGQRGAAPAGASSEEFWTKLEDMQRKYRHSLQKLLPVIRRLQDRQPEAKRDLFMSHLKDAFNILNMQRSSPVPERLTLTVLERAERFILQVVTVHSKYVQDMIGKDSTRKQQMVAQLDDYTGQVPVGAQQGAVIPSQAMSHLSTQRLAQQAKGETVLPQAAVSDLDIRRQQQYAQIQRQQLQQQKMQEMIRMQQTQASVQQAHHQQAHAQGPLNGVAAADLSKTIGKTSSSKSNVSRGQGNVKVTRGSQDLSVSRAMSGVMSGQQQLQNQVQAHGQGPVVAVAQQQARAVVQAQAAAARAHLESQAAQAQAQAQAQALAKVQAKSQRLQQMRPQQTSRVQQPRTQQNMQSQVPGVRTGPQGIPANAMNQQIPMNQQMPQWGGPQMTGPGFRGTVPSTTRAKRPELTIQQRLQMVDASVKEAVEHTQRLESVYDVEMKREKSERIQTTLAALRNNAGSASGDKDKGKSAKRRMSLVDVDNFGPQEDVIKSKTVFECSSEAGLRLAKRPKNEAADLRSLREAVEADCKAAKERNPLLMVEIIEEFGLPVVTCLLRIPEIRLPKLVLRVQRGYPRKGGATYGFERPPMGWIGVLDEIRTRFKRALATAPAASVGVAAFLDAWASEADNVINGSCMSEN